MENRPVKIRSLGPQHKQLRDVWNHASFLVQVAYDLEWAAIQFEMLEREAPDRPTKAILLLNIGITYSLLGRYRHAEKAFQRVLPLHPFTSPLAHFLLGILRFELCNYEQAQISFMLCANVLKQTDHNRDYRPIGLEFTLSHHLVVENEEIAAHEWTLKQKGRHGYRLLNRLPAACIFDTTVLRSTVGACFARAATSPSSRSTSSSSVYSVQSRGVSSIFIVPEIPEIQATSSMQTPRPRTTPVIPWRSLHKPMIPRAAQTQNEPSNLRSLTHFLKYTGPDDLQMARAEDTTNAYTPLKSIPERTTTPHVENHVVASSEGTGVPRWTPFRTAEQAGSGGLLRKVSTLTLESTPMERLGAANVGQARVTDRGRVVSGPQQRWKISTTTHLPSPTVHRAVFGTAPEVRGDTRTQPPVPERISMDSHMIFNQGGLVM
ncbi:hypothetical protein E4T39_08591 [Aureobasidium subglaciale]|nr:hypothetical protein E4T39_08591 [Aureobasidium subglaciale]